MNRWGDSHGMKKSTNFQRISKRGFKSYADDQLFAKLGEAAAQIASDKLCLGAPKLKVATHQSSWRFVTAVLVCFFGIVRF